MNNKIRFLTENSPPLGVYDVDQSKFAMLRSRECFINTADVSSHDYNGVLVGDPVWIEGPPGFSSALRFTKTNYVELIDETPFDLSDAITVAAWACIDQIGAQWSPIVTKGNSAWRLSTVADQRRFHFAVTGPAQGPHWVNGTQHVEFGEWHHLAGTYDGDTPQNLRRKIRSGANIILTNPDMLHQGILPQHARWNRFFTNLRYVVIDEVHAYRGVFGSHLANVMRRLLRICRHYGATPQFICSSATIANPAEHAERISGEPMELVDNDGSPRGPKRFILWNPPPLKTAASGGADDWRVGSPVGRRGV